ncbi:hypothetical protein WJX82_006162 [Trebouxia sp. C0006]
MVDQAAGVLTVMKLLIHKQVSKYHIHIQAADIHWQREVPGILLIAHAQGRAKYLTTVFSSTQRTRAKGVS